MLLEPAGIERRSAFRAARLWQAAQIITAFEAVIRKAAGQTSPSNRVIDCASDSAEEHPRKDTDDQKRNPTPNLSGCNHAKVRKNTFASKRRV